MARAQQSPGKRGSTKTRPPDWVEKTLRTMSLREKLGQMLMPHFLAVFTSNERVDHKRLLHLVENLHVGGFIVGASRGIKGLRRSQVYATAMITNELQSRAKIPLLLGADFESGTRMRLDEGTAFPSAMAVAAAGDPKLAYTVGKIVGLESRAAGIHWIFAPDADVNNNPDNPIINVRSFGEDPELVAQYVSEFVRGVEEHGALATAKHFPGHGNVTVDSHLALASVAGDRKRLSSNELVPFRAAIKAGVGSIMPGHLAVPAFEPDPSVPATLSHHVLSGLLRDELKFDGLIVTDAMDMAGVTSLYPPGEAAVRSVEAGADVLLQPPVPEAALAALEQAVGSGRIIKARINDSVRRILRAKTRLGLDKNCQVDIAELNRKFGLPDYEREAQNIADRGVTLLRDSPKLLPLNAARPMRVLLVSLSADPDAYPGETIEPELRARVDLVIALRADTRYSGVSNLKLPPPNEYDLVVAALFVRVADRKGNVDFPDEQRAFVKQLIDASKPTVIAAFGSPYLIERFPGAKTWLAVFSTNDVSQRAAVRALFGETQITGRIPVTVPGTVNRGEGLRVPANPMTLVAAPVSLAKQLKPTYALVDGAVRDGAFPGGVLAVGWKNQLARHAFGKFTYAPKSAPVQAETIYDVASLTKPIVTTTAVMMLLERGELDLDAPVQRYLPEFADSARSDPNPSWRSRVTVRMLLLHCSGLPAYRHFYKNARNRSAMFASALAEPLEHEPGTHIEYSDIGFVLLGEIIERLTGISLDRFANEHIFKPLRMTRSFFNPPRSLRSQIPPTEEDLVYRKHMIHGDVHDENACALGGVAGHAGLFSAASDVAAFAQMMLNGGSYAHHRLLARSTVGQFTTRTSIGNSAHGLGWDVPTEDSSSGHYFSASSFGHLGYTGTSLWIDPQKNLFVVLLTNRVHPTRENNKIRQVRPALHDAICKALGLTGANRPVGR